MTTKQGPEGGHRHQIATILTGFFKRYGRNRLPPENQGDVLLESSHVHHRIDQPTLPFLHITF